MNTPTGSTATELVSHTLAFCEECLNRQDFTAAWQSLGRALALAPSRADLLCHRGRLALFLKDADAAQRDFGRALKLDKRCAAAWSGMARYYIQQGGLAEAESAAESALGIDPSEREAAQVKEELNAKGFRATAATSGQPDRYWQNWDNNEAAAKIDAYWIAQENPWREILIADLKVAFKNNSRPLPILEVGCGSGLIFQKLLQHGCVTSESYCGGDISNNMLKLARTRFPNVQFQSLDIFNIGLPDSSQDNVINIHVLQHLPDYKHALRELFRITRKQLYVACWFNNTKDDQLRFSDASPKWDDQRFVNNNYSLPNFISYILDSFGDKVVDLRIHHFEGQNYSICITLK